MAELRVSAFTVPTEDPESDGTLEWDSTTLILVEAEAGGRRGLGYTYGPEAIGHFVREKLAAAVRDADPLSPPRTWATMQESIRNAGRPGVGAMAVSAVDVALWDLKARLLGVCLADALPRFHERVPVYGSGGFTSLSLDRLREQLARWAQLGRVKMKVGREPARDPERLRAAREAIGDGVELFVDANGAFTRKEALRSAERYAEHGVTYLEEPVSSEDVDGLRLLRDRTELDVAAGEYAWGLADVRPLLDAVDVVQADVTRVGGITAMLRVDGMCRARSLPFSAHCAPALSAHVCCAMETAAHIEYFHDHVRVERLLFDGTVEPCDGALEPDRSRPGLGLELKRSDSERYAA
jgi:L-alanine-DL-glutamate epimerase-like enolase superfamily enzyme